MSEPDDLQSCEVCEKAFDIEQMTMMEDCWFCPACIKEFQDAFAVCSHSWEPHINTMGDAGQYCTKCAGFVADEDFESLGLTHPKAAA